MNKNSKGSSLRTLSGHLLRVIIILGGVCIMMLNSVAPARGFGTINAADGQHAEHEMITRAALACKPNTRSDGSCFEPESLNQLAGSLLTFGAVGAPDMPENELFGHPEAHCDDADYLDVPGYPQSRDDANKALLACISHLHAMFVQGINRSAVLLKTSPSGEPELDFDQVNMGFTGCQFAFYVVGVAKCNVLEDFGRVLHGAQDFYAHSNWTDITDTSKGPLSINNPPGLDMPAPSPLLELRSAVTPSIPKDLTTGFFKGVNSDVCPANADDGRITHKCLNKDKEVIDPATGLIQGQPFTPRGLLGGKVGTNAQNAVTGAILETISQWNDFRQELLKQYGEAKGKLIITALTQDVQRVDLSFAIDTTGSMGSAINAVKAEAAHIVELLADKDHPVDFRIGLVDYKDFYASCASDGYAAQVDLDFSTDEEAITNAINSLEANGGCDTPESVYSGFIKAISMPWRTGLIKKVVIQMGDAPPHDPEPTTGYTEDDVAKAAEDVDPAILYSIDINGGGGPLIQSLVTRSGGKVFTVSTGDEIVNAILTVIQEVSTPVNQAPIANAGPDQSVGCSGNTTTQVTLNGTSSTDPEGSKLTYSWTADGVAFDDATSPTPTGAFPTGVTTVTLQVNDGEISAADTVVVEVKPCIQINEQDQYTNTRDVVLSLSYQSGPAFMRLSNSPFKTGDKKPQWQTFASDLQWQLSAGNGKKTVYVQFQLASGMVSKIFSDSITFDSKKPIVRDIEINKDQCSTNNPKVHVTIKSHDKLSGVKYMRIANTRGDLSKAAWIPYTKEFDWTLLPLKGSHAQLRHVYVQIEDGAQNVSRVFTDSILLAS